MNRLVLVLVAVTSVVAAVFSARLAVAHWLTFSPDIPSALPAASGGSPEASYALAPGDRSFSYWHAARVYERFQNGWLDPRARETGHEALTAARAVTGAIRADPFASSLAGSVMLDLARHPRTDDDDRADLAEGALAALSRALELWPTSAEVGLNVEAILLRRWSEIGPRGQELAASAARQVGNADVRAFEGAFVGLVE